MGEKRITANSLCMIRRWFTLSTSCFTSRLVDMLLSNLGNLTMFVFSLTYPQASARNRCPATWWAFLFVNFRPSNLGLFGFPLQTCPREKKKKEKRGERKGRKRRKLLRTLIPLLTTTTEAS